MRSELLCGPRPAPPCYVDICPTRHVAGSVLLRSAGAMDPYRGVGTDCQSRVPYAVHRAMAIDKHNRHINHMRVRLGGFGYRSMNRVSVMSIMLWSGSLFNLSLKVSVL